VIPGDSVTSREAIDTSLSNDDDWGVRADVTEFPVSRRKWEAVGETFHGW
jgi:hypothetical protein